MLSHLHFSINTSTYLIMTIALKIKKTQLNCLIELLQEQQITKPEEIAEKCMFYLYTSVLKKMLKKQITKSDDFTNKPFKIDLKYEEATGLYMQLQKIPPQNNVYVGNVLIQISNFLHQKLK